MKKLTIHVHNYMVFIIVFRTWTSFWIANGFDGISRNMQVFELLYIPVVPHKIPRYNLFAGLHSEVP